jgi:hypothetical protein
MLDFRAWVSRNVEERIRDREHRRLDALHAQAVRPEQA